MYKFPLDKHKIILYNYKINCLSSSDSLRHQVRVTKMINVAVVGFGVVGSGVVELLDKNNRLFSKKLGQDISCKYILDIRKFPDSPYASKFVSDFSVIENDPEINIVVETVGGATFAYEYTKRALSAGKHVVTSNKELVAKHAPELLALARQNKVCYLFEASVGGGIPIINPMYHCLAANELNKIVGIMNGTTNYILTKMIKEGVSFDSALKQAQLLGYAEKDPSADVDGIDTGRKICILASLAFGRHIYPENVMTKGIRGISLEDIYDADRQGMVVKLLGYAEKKDDGCVDIFVSPCAIPKDHPLANIEDVFNGITVTGDAIGDCTFYGKGAGKMPTASAVGADIIDCIKGTEKSSLYWVDADNSEFVRSFDKLDLQYFKNDIVLLKE